MEKFPRFVYVIPCADYPYISEGETGNIKKILEQHKSELKKKKKKSVASNTGCDRALCNHVTRYHVEKFPCECQEEKSYWTNLSRVLLKRRTLNRNEAR